MEPEPLMRDRSLPREPRADGASTIDTSRGPSATPSATSATLEQRSGGLVPVTLRHPSISQMYDPVPPVTFPTFSTFGAQSKSTSLERRSSSLQRSLDRSSHSSRSQIRDSRQSSNGSSQVISDPNFDPIEMSSSCHPHGEAVLYRGPGAADKYELPDDPAISRQEPGDRHKFESTLESQVAPFVGISVPESGSCGRTNSHKKPGATARGGCTDHGYTADDEYEEKTVKELLRSLQNQVATMSRNLSSKLDSIQADRHMEANDQLHVVRCQLTQLTRSVDTYQHEVSEVRKDVHEIRHEIDQLQHTKDEIEELRDCVDRLDQQRRKRKRNSMHQGLTCYLISAIFAAVLGMFQFGYNTGVINAPQEIIQKFIIDVWKSRYDAEIDTMTLHLIWSGAVSIFAIGGMIGGFSGAYIANRFGRKGGLLFNDGIGILGATLMGLSQVVSSFEILIVGRLVIGYNCGLSTSLVPMYVSEIAPVSLRGGVGIANQLAVTVGLLLSQVLGLNQLLGTETGWPLLLGLAICPSVLQLIVLPMCPESPRYLLITRKKEKEARRALRLLRNDKNIEDDVDEMKAEDRAQHAEARITMWQLIQSPSMRAPLGISIIMQLSQQLSGINAVFYYSTDIFQDAHLSEDRAKYATMGVGMVMVLMTIVSILLIEREGRRTLHLWGLGGMFFFSVFITISFLVKQMIDWIAYLAVISTFGFVVFFAVGPGSIPWMITAELFSQGPRPAAMSIAVLINWLCNFLIGIAFLPLKGLLEDYTFLPFSISLGLFWIFTYQCVPETKGKTFEEISALFRPSRSIPSGSEPVLEDNYGSTVNCLNSVDYAEGSAPRNHYRVQSPFDRSDSDPLVCTMAHSTASSRHSLHGSLERSHGLPSSAAVSVHSGSLGPCLIDHRGSMDRLERLSRRSGELA